MGATTLVFGSGKPQPSRETKGNRNRVKWIGLAVIVAIIAVAPVVLATLDRPQSTGSVGAGGNGNELSVCCVPATLHSLKGNSTLVVVAKVASLAGTYSQGFGLIYDYQIRVATFLKGSGPPLLYVETGGASSPQLEVGQSYVLFLWQPESQLLASCQSFNLTCVPPPTLSSITYPPTASAEGVFLINNGLVYGMKTLHPQYGWIKIVVNGEAETSFISEVMAA